MHAACACSADAVTTLLRHPGAEEAKLHAKDEMGRTALMQMLLLPLGVTYHRRRSNLVQSSGPPDPKVQTPAQVEADKAAHAMARRKSISLATEKVREHSTRAAAPLTDHSAPGQPASNQPQPVSRPLPWSRLSPCLRYSHGRASP